MMNLSKRCAAVAAVAIAAVCGGPATVGAAEPQPAVAAVSAFHADIHADRKKAALALLAPDVYIAQQGFVDIGRDHYAGARIANDVAFAQATHYKRLHRHVIHIDADAEIVITQVRRSGNFKGTPVDIIQVETMLVEQRGGGWHIAAIHWSAHAAPKSTSGASPSAGTPPANKGE